jgi:hypothetical protein
MPMIFPWSSPGADLGNLYGWPEQREEPGTPQSAPWLLIFLNARLIPILQAKATNENPAMQAA